MSIGVIIAILINHYYNYCIHTGRLKKTGPCFISLYLWQFITVWTGNTLLVCCTLSLAYQMIVKAYSSVLPVHTVINCQRYRLIAILINHYYNYWIQRFINHKLSKSVYSSAHQNRQNQMGNLF